MNDELKRDLKQSLTPEEYRVCVEKGTEAPFSGKLLQECRAGKYLCLCCNEVLFDSESKFEAHCGWPSFDQALENKVTYTTDRSHNMIRTEITCTQCGAHLGHVFDDGPTQTGQRYCVNSVSLVFQPQESDT